MSIQSAISFSTAMQSGLTFAAPEGLSVVEQAKRLAARRAVDEHWPADATVVGIGSGSTVVYVVERIRELGPERTGHVVFIPTGFQSMQLITGSGLRLGAIEHYPVMDIAFDGADECDANLDVIKGGGACLFQEKLVALGARKFVVVADYRKNSEYLGQQWKQGVPIEVVGVAQSYVTRQLLALGCTKPVMRMGGSAKAGPVVTDNGNLIFDAQFDKIPDPAKLAHDIKQIVGVVDVGLFIGMADHVYFGNQDGSVLVKNRDGTVQHISA